MYDILSVVGFKNLIVNFSLKIQVACITQVIKKLGGEFAIKDFGNLHYFLRIEVKPFPRGLFSLASKICEGPSSSN